MLAYRAHVLGHFLGVGAAAVQAAIDQEGSVGRAIDAITAEQSHRLRPLPRVEMGPIQRIVSAYHLGDPVYPSDSWRPLLRRRRLAPYERALEAAAAPAPATPSDELEIHHQGQVVGGQPGQGA